MKFIRIDGNALMYFFKRRFNRVSKLICIEQVAEFLHDGMVVMFGGFLGVGTPEEIIQVIIDNGVSNIWI